MYDHKDGITLRKIEKIDLPDLLKLKNESWWGTHNTSIINFDDQVNWYNNIPNDQLFLIGETAKSSVGVAAYTKIDWISRTLHISGSVFKNHRNQFSQAGFCAGLDFAFEILNMRRVEAEVLEYHIPARILEVDVLGFTIEGRKRKAVYKAGRYYDSIMLGLLRSEWQNQARVKDYGDACNLNFSHDKFKKLMQKLS
jgi:RimJ/RimL family protein N-acetyltransferase